MVMGLLGGGGERKRRGLMIRIRMWVGDVLKDECLSFVYYFYQTIQCCTNYICTAWNSLVEIITVVTTDGNLGVDIMRIQIYNAVV